jgi:cytochrome c551/c552
MVEQRTANPPTATVSSSQMDGDPMKPGFLILVAAFMQGGAAQAQDVPSLMDRYGCYMCHANDEAKAGPAFADVAAKYRGNPKAAAIVISVVSKGRHGNGPWPMPPLPQVPNADARKIARYILSLKK